MTFSLDDIIRAAIEVQTERVVRLYDEERWTITQVAREVGLSRETVYRRLKDAGVYRGPTKGHSPVQEKCQREHDMAEWGREIPKERGGGRYCAKCKRDRDREAWQRRKGKGQE